MFRFVWLAAIAFFIWPTSADARQTGAAPTSASSATAAAPGYPTVTFGVLSFLQYAADLHEADGYNAFDITRGYLDIRAQLSPRVRFRFTPDVRPTTDANLDRNLALRLAYGALYAAVRPHATVAFGLHETPWLTFEESINRYRVMGPFFAERVGLVAGATDLGVSLRLDHGRTEVHTGVYNGEGDGRAEFDKYKSVEGRVTYRPLEAQPLRISGFLQYGYYARDRPRHLALVMASYEQPRVVMTAQYLAATDNPYVAADISRRGLSLFGEYRQGLTGWAAVGSLDLFDEDTSDDGNTLRRLSVGGAHWQQMGQARVGLVVSFEQSWRASFSQLTARRLLAQTHIEF